MFAAALAPVALGLALYGIALGTLCVALIVYDLCAVFWDKTTISRWCLETAKRQPLFACAVGFFFGLNVGGLLAHLFLLQAP